MVRMGEIWDRTVEALGDRLGALMAVAIPGFFVPMSILNAIGGLWATASPGLKGGLMIAFFALYLIVLWAYLAITAIVIDPLGRATGSLAVRRLPAAIGAYLLIALAVMLLSIPIGVLIALAGVDLDAMQRGVTTAPSSPGMVWSAILYLLVFLVVALVVGARLLGLSGVIVAERRGVGAIARAWRLTGGLTWRLIGVLLLYVVVMQVAIMAAQTVFGSILRIFAGGSGPLNVATVVTGIIVAGVQAGFSLLGAVFAAKLYEATVRTDPAAPPLAPRP